MERTTGRMATTIERVFRPLPNGLFREITLHFINFLNADGSIRSTKLDKEIPGGLYKIATSDTDRSQYGEVMYQFPGGEKPVRLLCLGRDVGDFRYGRF